jgi:DNA invertase Pin-like site-specific DNA recombinase
MFEDLDISGKAATNRPAYQRLLARLGPEIQYVVAYDLSRFTRDGDDLKWTTASDAGPRRGNHRCDDKMP